MGRRHCHCAEAGKEGEIDGSFEAVRGEREGLRWGVVVRMQVEREREGGIKAYGRLRVSESVSARDGDRVGIFFSR